MKFTKMSLVAALLIGSSAFAIDNVKVSGDAKLYYSTSDSLTDSAYNNATPAPTTPKASASLGHKDTSAAQAAFSLGVTADLTKGVSAGFKTTALTTLGLEGQLVDNVWEGTNGTADSFIVNEAWLAATLGKTTAKIGRMELDTPLVFSEKWSIIANTFEAAVVINQDLPDTTLVGAYVGGSNHGGHGQNGSGIGGVIAPKGNNTDTTFSQFWSGAYAAGAINNSFKPLTVQAWYYDASHTTEAYWLQADLNMNGIIAGAQYSSIDLSQVNAALTDANAYALMLGYGMKDMFTAKVSYSQVSDDNKVLSAGGAGAAAGAGFNLAGTVQSKLYTESFWNYGKVIQSDTQSFNVTVESPVNGMFDLGVYYTDADQSAAAGDNDMTELTVTASKTVGPLDVTLAYINSDVKTAALNDDETSNRIQAYLTLNF